MIPAGSLRPKYRHVFTLIGVLLLVCASVAGQTRSSSVIITATVSETVVVSVLPSSTHGNVVIDGPSSGSTVQLTLSGTDGSPVIRVPLLLRSNSGFKISAVFTSETAVLNQLSVIEARATGSLVSPDVVRALEFKPQFDPDTSQPLLVLMAPRISLGGTLQSPNNALQVTLLIRVKPTRAWSGHLTLTATAGSQVQ